MKFTKGITEKTKTITFEDIRCGEPFTYGGWLIMKCVIDGSRFNAVNLESGYAFRMMGNTEVRPIHAIIAEQREDGEADETD